MADAHAVEASNTTDMMAEAWKLKSIVKIYCSGVFLRGNRLRIESKGCWCYIKDLLISHVVRAEVRGKFCLSSIRISLVLPESFRYLYGRTGVTQG